MFYVSPDGSDSAAGTEKKPFQSLARAAKAVAETEKKQDITVYLRGGEYKITEPVSLNSANGGAGNVSEYKRLGRTERRNLARKGFAEYAFP